MVTTCLERLATLGVAVAATGIYYQRRVHGQDTTNAGVATMVTSCLERLATLMVAVAVTGLYEHRVHEQQTTNVRVATVVTPYLERLVWQIHAQPQLSQIKPVAGHAMKEGPSILGHRAQRAVLQATVHPRHL